MFLDNDTEAAIALAEEEAETCPSCGFLKVWCRDPDNQFLFGVAEEQCHATYALMAHMSAVSESRDETTKRAIQTRARFLSTASPDLFAGLDLPEIADQEQQRPRDGEAG